MTEKDLKKMSELEIIRLIKNPDTDEFSFNKASEYLLKRYDNMFHKHWWVLQKQMGNSDLINSLKDEYYALAYEAFFTVIQKIDLDRIYDGKFKLMQLLSWYLTNVRSKLIKETLKKGKMKNLNEVKSSMEGDSSSIDSDVERSYWDSEGYKIDPSYKVVEIQEGEENCKRAIKECMSKWNDREKEIFKYLEKGMSKVEIANTLKITPLNVYSTTNKMKKELKNALGLKEELKK